MAYDHGVCYIRARMPTLDQAPRPNFLIVGAAKCGSTTLYQALARHPAIFLPALKEPRFLAWEGWPQPPRGPGDGEMFRYSCGTLDEYLDLFASAGGSPLRGEASADTFYYHAAAIPRIREVLGDPKIIVLLRDPARRAFSAWAHLRRDERETLSFRDALAAEAQRRADGFEFLWHLKAASRYAEGVRSFQQSFSHVQVIEFEQLVAEPEPALAAVCAFLGVSADPLQGKLPAANPSGEPRRKGLYRALRDRAAWKEPLKRLLPAEWRRRLKERVLDSMLLPVAPDQEALHELRLEFREETEALADLLGWSPRWAQHARSAAGSGRVRRP